MRNVSSFTMADQSMATIFSVAAATSSSSLECTTGLSLLESMVSYLRKEAVLADEKAKRLRKQAAEIAKEFGITDESQKLYEMDPAELPPLDEKGMPKYKGKKRGPKPKARKRKVKAGRQKRKHTGYTLFMQETYPKAKIENPDLPPKALISIMAKLWRNLAAGGKREWKERAETVNSDDTKDDSDWLCSVQTF
ncbi:unnamed protein product [Pseudo-nitzschia multistriata]|uniref:HMG box domain-containing protein n=1 Tax=Pseudo-nitzschia multistriata TaxID=183589 RepID=A0A448ZCA7_9STRA|nr:unnamed protein product [Pseudo-nitzschia multistriata]